MTGHLVARAAGLVIGGVAGAAVLDRIKRPATGAAVKRAAVSITALSLRGRRRLENGAEHLRLTAGDVVAEARERVGEPAPPPARPAQAHDHDH